MRSTLAVVCAGLLLPTSLIGQEIEIFLNTAATDTIPIRAGAEYTLVARNAIPGTEYTLQDVPVRRSIDPIGISGATNECPIKSLTSRFERTSSEDTVAVLVETLTTLVKNGSCKNDQLAAVEKLIESTNVAWKIGPYEKSTIVILTIRRAGIGSQVARSWIRHLETPPDGKWETIFGFTFLWQVLEKPDSYFASESSDVYVITAEENPANLAFAPTVLFRWASADDEGKEWVWSKLLGGLGATLGNSPFVTVMVSTGVTYRRNLTFYAGLSVGPVQTLKGEYYAGQVVTESLSEDQLHTTHYGVNPVFGVAYRFGSSPWKKQTLSPTSVYGIPPNEQ